MKTKQIKIYEFGELSEEVQEKVLNKFRENNEYDLLNGELKGQLIQEIEAQKIEELKETKLRYSLSHCQGDGLSFTGSFKYESFIVTIQEGSLSNYYSHKNTVDIEVEYDYEIDGLETKEPTEAEETEVKEIFLNIMDKLEKFGYSYIEAEDDDETIKENIYCNEYTFRENGEIESI